MSLATGQFEIFKGEEYYKISNSNLMEEFFISLSGSSDHWMFISSRGAVTAGRGKAENSLFPYYSDDKISDVSHSAGPKTIIAWACKKTGEVKVWEPFSASNCLQNEGERQQSIYKNAFGNKMVFEEVNHELGLTFRYRWTFGHRFGFVRTCWLESHRDEPVEAMILDGVENVMPSGLGVDFQMKFSNLANAYKKNELVEVECGSKPSSRTMGLYYLSSVPTDRAEPSEGLRANVVWHDGVEASAVLLSSDQLNKFVTTGLVDTETDVRARRGAYFVKHAIDLKPGEESTWSLVADTGLDLTDVMNLSHWMSQTENAWGEIQADIEACEVQLKKLISSSDGFQTGNNKLALSRHRANVLFNIMRGGTPVNGYQVDVADFRSHLQKFNSTVAEQQSSLLDSLESRESLTLEEMLSELVASEDPDLIRIGREYLPLTFSRRHGDPTRPWNTFSIQGFANDGSHELDYQGNWRDIFQNWEALAQSYPALLRSMVFRFLNASTADGYNAYRITKDGFEWEKLDPEDPWSNIGFWGDHQIVYLLKLLEWSRKYFPNDMERWLNTRDCVYADVPYRIRGYEDILKDPRSTITFDDELDKAIEERVETLGADGKLLLNSANETCRVTAGEKLLLPALVKLTNFVPGGGIWLNTQRPEWNDANNALVGTGLSVVTVCYLRRMFAFYIDWFETSDFKGFDVSKEVSELLGKVEATLSQLPSTVDDASRMSVVESLGRAGEAYRNGLYEHGLTGEQAFLERESLIKFFKEALKAIDTTILESRREDGLYHSYNLLVIERDSSGAVSEFGIESLQEMLEGQVAVLSSGLLGAEDAVELLDALRSSAMYREDQQSYMLYPDRELPRFNEKNIIPDELVAGSFLAKAVETHSRPDAIVRRDAQGKFHFGGSLRNAEELNAVMDDLVEEATATSELKSADGQTAVTAESLEEDRELLLNAFEEVFQHRKFVGRSGTFFGYEGLGCIYWHMVSKLVLAVQENLIAALAAGESESPDPELLKRLHVHYREIRDGLGVLKNPGDYGAFPTDPYSHTPKNGGAKQPGMTGQVKEDILSRFGELGLRVSDGVLRIEPTLFESSEWLTEPASFRFVAPCGEWNEIELAVGSFAFTWCQVPFVFHKSDDQQIKVDGKDGVRESTALMLTEAETKSIAERAGDIKRVDCYF